MSLAAAGPRALRLNPRDNVAVAVRPLAEGDILDIAPDAVPIAEDIPVGHKVALSAIPAGGAIVKYGEIVGRATAAIERGRHVHVHNVVSSRLPGVTR